jgi:hypothetical protein
MAEKEWVDIEDFLIVLAMARVKHRALHPANAR